MDKEKFYNLILSDNNCFGWLVTFWSVILDPNSEYKNRTNVFEFLEQVRTGLVNDMNDWQVIESVTEAVRAEINA